MIRLRVPNLFVLGEEVSSLPDAAQCWRQVLSKSPREELHIDNEGKSHVRGKSDS